MERRKRLVARKRLARKTELSRKPKVAEPGGAPKPKGRRDTGPSPEMRAMVYARDLGLCVRCGVAVKEIPHSIHHRSRRSQLGLNEFQNLITLCGSGSTGCHGHVHAHVTESEYYGYLVRSGNGPESDPLQVPVAYATPGGTARRYLTEDGDWVAEGASAA